MKLKLVAAISALAIPALAHAQQVGPQPNVPKPTKADAQIVLQIVTNDKAKTRAYCDLNKLYAQVEADASEHNLSLCSNPRLGTSRPLRARLRHRAVPVKVSKRQLLP